MLSNDTFKKHYVKNGDPQSSVLSPMLFNIYTADLPTTTAKKYICADDTATVHKAKSFNTLEGVLSNYLISLNNSF